MPSEPQPDVSEEPVVETVTEVAEPENGHASAEPVETLEEPAKMKVQIEGTAGAVRAAARKVANSPAAPPPVVTPSNDPEIPEDNTDALLMDPHNMVIVQRTFPKKVIGPGGQKIRTGTVLPEPYPCPTSRQEIEEDVFDNFGGYKYKCTIHPNTTNGRNTMLGAFTIEHPDGADSMPIIEGLEQPEPPPDPRFSAHTSSGDGTMRETDPFAKRREEAELRLARAKAKKDAIELETEAKRMEDEIASIGKPVVPPQAAVSVESEELRKLREQNAQLAAQLVEKKTNDRFDKLENSIAQLATSVTALATARPAANPESTLMTKLFDQSQTHAKDMLTLVTNQLQAARAPAKGDDLDTFLGRAEKLQAIVGGGGKGHGRGSAIEDRLIDLAWKKLEGGGEDDDDRVSESGDLYEDAIKLAIKEFAPVAKTYVERKMNQEAAANGGQQPSQETMQKIYQEAGIAAARKVQEDLLSQGIRLVADESGKLRALAAPKGSKPAPRLPASRVVSETKTSEGVVKKVAVEPHDLRPKPKSQVEPEPETERKETEVPKCGAFPMLGPNGTELKIPFPASPGDLQYDRKASVNFVLDGIRSEILQQYPQKSQTDTRLESYVAADAIEYLDDELLDKLLNEVDDGPKLEALLAPWGEVAKISEIKKAGESEVVSAYLRKLVLTIQREWDLEKKAQPK